MINPEHEQFMAGERQQLLLREAEKRRLLNGLRPPRPALRRRLMASLGAWMVTHGARLQNIQPPAPTRQPLASGQ